MAEPDRPAVRPLDEFHDQMMAKAEAENGKRRAARTADMAAMRTAILREAATALTGRHCSPESVDIVLRLIDERLCTGCQGYGQTSTPTPDGGIVRRCKPCNGKGLRRLAAEEA